MARRGRTAAIVGACGVLWACGSSGKPASSAPQPVAPLVVGHWTFLGTGQGLSADVRDVSPDEGGNVYVAGWDAVYAKRRDEQAFRRFTAENAGLSRRCNDAQYVGVEVPGAPFFQCPVVAVGGGAPGKAFVGYENVLGQAADSGADWAHEAGGADVVAFDGARGTMSLTRHVLTGAPPHVICDDTHDQWVPTCAEQGYWWTHGRRLFRGVRQIEVNHDRASPMYGDAWMGGEHATLAVLLENAAARGWVDIASQSGPAWADARDFWEHHHPAVVYTGCDVQDCFWQIVGQGEGISIDPLTGTPWGSSGLRTTSVTAYGADLSYRQWGMSDALDLWKDDPADPYYGPTNDRVKGLSHCPDGTLWIASLTHGLARRDPSGAVSTLPLPDDAAGAVSIACDPSDASLWIGLGTGGLLRHAGGTFTRVTVPGAPAFAGHPPVRIRFDRWTGGLRLVYVAYAATFDDAGRMTAPGGIGVYDGP